MNYLELWTQTQIAERWQVSEGTLERWRSEGIGPIFLKLQGQVRYRLSDVVAFEEASLRRSTSESYNAGNDRR
jgi:predicted site-specific integrase-resolvase